MVSESSTIPAVDTPRPPLAGKRIIISLVVLDLGGAERQALLLARYLADVQQAHVEVWGLLGEPGRVAELCEEYGLKWHIEPLRSLSTYRARDRLRDLARYALALRRARPDILLPYMMIPNVINGLTWRLTGARTCIWNQRDPGLERTGRRQEKLAVRLMPWFISNSQQGANFLVGELGADKARVRVVRNGVELSPPLVDRPTWRQQLGLQESDFAACMVANLHSLKDHATLIKAWRLVVDKMENNDSRPVLLLAGRLDVGYEIARSLVDSLQLDAHVQFLGSVNDISGLLSAVDLCVFSSRAEGSPNGVLEAMAGGLAVVGTDVPGIHEAVATENHHYLAPPGDAEVLAEHILKLAECRPLRVQLGAINKQRIATEFTPQRMCADTVNVILESLGQAPDSKLPTSG